MMNIIVFLYSLQNGDFVSHLACTNSKVDMITYLLHTGKVNPLAQNNHQKTPLEEVRLNDPNRLENYRCLSHLKKVVKTIQLIHIEKCLFVETRQLERVH